MRKIIPGPLKGISRPSLKITPLSYSRSILIAAERIKMKNIITRKRIVIF
jgi:hypothetical protein